MLLIGNEERSGAPLAFAARRAQRISSTLMYWEQITALEVDGEGTRLVIDDREVPPGTPIVVSGFPRFLCPTRYASGDVEFAWSEWLASLQGVLQARDRSVRNARQAIYHAGAGAPGGSALGRAASDAWPETVGQLAWALVTPLGARGFDARGGAALVPSPLATVVQRALATLRLDFLVFHRSDPGQPVQVSAGIPQALPDAAADDLLLAVDPGARP